MEASRLLEAVLVKDYEKFLGQKPVRKKYVVAATGENLISAAFDTKESELLAAKPSSARMHVRLALGNCSTIGGITDRRHDWPCFCQMSPTRIS